MKKRSRVLLSLLILCAFPATAHANAGTPLMWAGISHMVLGNAVIGLVEGLILARVFRLKWLKTVALLIAANYFSAWIGALLLGTTVAKALPLNLYNAWPLLWVMVLFTYLVTLLFEWPFIMWALEKTKGWFWRSVRASLLIQTISYVAVFGWYWSASGTSLYTELDVVKLSEMDVPNNVEVYYISEADGDVYRRSLRGEAQKVFNLRSESSNDRLALKPNAEDAERFDLVALLETENYNHPDVMLLGPLLDLKAVAFEVRGDSAMRANMDTLPDFGAVPRLGDAADSRWEFETGFWAVEGMHARRDDGAHVHFAFETPFAAWYVRDATHLPTDKVLFRLGKHQICLFDPETKQIALVTYGRGPVAVITE